MNRIAVFTCVTAGYDVLRQPWYIHPDFDYICFVPSDDPRAGSSEGVWHFRATVYSSEDPRVLSRFPKINPHLVLPDYEYSLWLDGNITVADPALYDAVLSIIAPATAVTPARDGSADLLASRGGGSVLCSADLLASRGGGSVLCSADLLASRGGGSVLCSADLLASRGGGSVLYCGIRHPDRDCAYLEAWKCACLHYISYPSFFRTVRFLRAEGLPRHAGLMENNVILRRHMDPTIIRQSEIWWNLFLRLPLRDQFTHTLSLLRSGVTPGLLIPAGKNVKTWPWFALFDHIR